MTSTKDILADIKSHKAAREFYLHRIAQLEQTLKAVRERLRLEEDTLQRLADLPAKIEATKENTMETKTYESDQESEPNYALDDDSSDLQ